MESGLLGILKSSDSGSGIKVGRLGGDIGSLRSSLEGVFKGRAEPIHDTEVEESANQLEAEEDDPNKPCFTSFFFTNCSPRQFLMKSSSVLLFCAIISGLAILLEPAYPEVKVYTPKSHALCMKDLVESLPGETIARIEDKYSPQAKAFQWIDNDPKLNAYPTWRHRQRLALATIYYAFNGVLWSEEDRKDWLSYSVSECDWDNHGEKICDEETMRMERLVLSNIRNFRGTMPPEINLLAPTEISITHMTSQSFAMQDLLQTDKAVMARLKKLDFSHTRLHGSIPDDIGWMKYVEEINFSHCSFLEGTLPAQLGLFDNLRILLVQGNELTGPIPEAITSLRKLEHIDLQRNALTGHLPDAWCSMTSLVSLHLDDNYLEGAIPHCMTTMPSLVAFTHVGTNLIAP